MRYLHWLKPKKCWLWLLGLPVLYTSFVLGFVWWHCHKSGLEGGKYGPLDAYRHTLASALVAYTTTPRLVSATTKIMEYKNRPIDLMDQHNNAIGAEIGVNAESLFDLDAAVKNQVAHGTIDASSAQQTTWLPPQYWLESLLW